MRVNSAGLAETVLRGLGPKAVQRQVVLTFQDMHGVGESRYRRRTAPAAKTAVNRLCAAIPWGRVASIRTAPQWQLARIVCTSLLICAVLLVCLT